MLRPASRITLAVLVALLAIATPARFAVAQSIPFVEASVGSPDNRTFTVTWTSGGATSMVVYAGTDPAHIGRDHAVGHGGAAGKLIIADLPTAARWYFELVPNRGHSLVIADRNLHLATAPNFRDAGGYRTKDGKWVRMGLLYRSDGLDQLSNADLATLHDVGLHLVCDLRTDGERSRGQDRLPTDAEALIADVSGADGMTTRMMAVMNDKARQQEVLGNGGGAQVMIDASRQFVDSPSALKAYKAVFQRLADRRMLPGVFHCSAGKDRTGWAEAVFLGIMGVPSETIMRDYLLSNAYLEVKNRHALDGMKSRIDPILMEPLITVRAEYLAAGFDEVAKRYGSFARYLHDGLGLDEATIAALRREFLIG